MKRIVVAGASLAGLRAAETLRRDGFDGEIHLVGEEPHQPYDRPPLSKQVLAGEWDPERIALARPEQIDDLSAEWHLGVRVERLDLDERSVTLDTGASLSFDGLVIATGARCRTLPGVDGLSGVHTLRTLDDSLAAGDFNAAWWSASGTHWVRRASHTESGKSGAASSSRRPAPPPWMS